LYQTQAFHELLCAMREHGKRNSPDFVLFHEEPHEQLIPYLDGFHVREYYEKRWYRGLPGAVGIPLFSYLYHEYAIGYGGDSAGVSKGKNAWLVRNHAVNLVSGRTPGIAVWSSTQSALDAHADQLTMLRNHCRLLATRAKDCLMLGKMLHPFELRVPKLRFPLNGGGGEKGSVFESPSVLTSSWQSPAGAVGHLFVNISETRQPLEVALDTRNAPAWKTCDADVYRSADAAFQPLWRGAPLPKTFRVELAPLEAVFVEMRESAER
jgi:hypothetical protein